MNPYHGTPETKKFLQDEPLFSVRSVFRMNEANG
jgi:hypothetical protein